MTRTTKKPRNPEDIVPLFHIQIPREVAAGMTDRPGYYDVDHQFAEARLGDLIHGYYAGVCGSAAASAEAFENYDGTFFAETLPNRPTWCLHAAKMGNVVILHAGFLTGLSDDDEGLIPEKFPDEVRWIFRENQNETWLHVFKDDIRRTIELTHFGNTLCRVRFSVEHSGCHQTKRRPDASKATTRRPRRG
jgi:hypothetical protein